MRKKNKCKCGKKIVACVLVAGFMLSLTACGNKDYGNHEKGVANPDTTQTQFAIMGAQSALSPGYTNNLLALLWAPWVLDQFGVSVPFFSASADNAAVWD